MSVLSNLWSWWNSRALRERRMLMLMGVMVIMVGGWLGVVRPLQAWQVDQARAHERAAQDLRPLQTALTHSAVARPQDFDLQTLMQQSATEQGVQPVLAMSEGGSLGFRVDRASTAQAFGWLAALEAGGARIEELAVIKNPDASLAITGALS